MHPIPKLKKFLNSSCRCLCPIHWSQVLSLEWRCSWSSAHRRCSNYIEVISNFIAYKGVAYIWGLMASIFKLISRIDILSTSCEIGLRWVPWEPPWWQVQVMVWCFPATAIICQSWTRSMWPYGIIVPQWIQAMLMTLLHCNSVAH